MDIYIYIILNIWIILYITVLFDMSSLHLGHTNAILRSKLSVPSFWTQEFQPTNGRFDGSDLFLL